MAKHFYFLNGKRHVVYVKSYDLFLDIDFKSLRFSGNVVIELESEGDVNLNSLDLNILNVGSGGKSFQFRQEGENLVVETGSFKGRLTVEYSGSIPDILTGIYRAPYADTYLITTQFEAANARRMLPCVDHPEYKAEFKLTLRIYRDLVAISNMPVESVSVEGDRKVVSFHRTPRMSSYLLYIGVGRFEEHRDRLGGIDVVVATTPNKAGKADFAKEVAKKSIELCQSYFGIPYMLPKIHLISIPEFAAGAMENWGAIAFRETALYVDENSGIKTRKRVAYVVAHEVAHQWFGNLVTMKWWNDLWLNESFGTLMGYKLVDAICSQWKMWQDFLISEASGAMARDSLVNTHPIEVEVTSPSEIGQIFDEISYGKGACILRMIEAYLGTDDFREGVRKYLARHKFSNAAGKDLWSLLEETSGEQVETIMSRWIEKPGYPVVTATISEGKLRLRQERFLLSGRFEKDTWPIPVTMRLNGESRRLLLNKEEEVIDFKELRSLKLNVDQTGFYRVYYRGLYDLLWSSELSALDRWGIISDALAFLVSGKMSFSEYFSILERYYNEEEYLPAYEASNQLSFLYLIAPSRVSETSRVFHRTQLKILEGKADENSSMLRGIVAGRLAMVDEDYSRELGSEFRSYEEVEPDMREAVAIAYARAYSDFEKILEKYRKMGTDEERIRMLYAMINCRETSQIASAFGLALTGEVKRQDVRTMIHAAAGNPDAREVTWTWIKTNMQRLRQLYQGTGVLSQLLLSVIPIIGIGRVDEVESFFHERKVPEAEKGIEAGLEKLKIHDRLAKEIS